MSRFTTILTTALLLLTAGSSHATHQLVQDWLNLGAAADGVNWSSATPTNQRPSGVTTCSDPGSITKDLRFYRMGASQESP